MRLLLPADLGYPAAVKSFSCFDLSPLGVWYDGSASHFYRLESCHTLAEAGVPIATPPPFPNDLEC